MVAQRARFSYQQSKSVFYIVLFEVPVLVLFNYSPKSHAHSRKQTNLNKMAKSGKKSSTESKIIYFLQLNKDYMKIMRINTSSLGLT
jgi:hypothetical protein